MNIQTIISLITILCFGQSQQRSVPRHHSHHMQRRSEQQDTAAEDSLAALEREVTRERREAELTGSSEEAELDTDLRLVSLLVDRVILQSLRDQRKLLTARHHSGSERRHRHRRQHRSHASHASDMIPYPRAG